MAESLVAASYQLLGVALWVCQAHLYLSLPPSVSEIL